MKNLISFFHGDRYSPSVVFASRAGRFWRNESGQLIVAAVLIMMVLLILTPLFVRMGREESLAAVKGQKSMVSFNLAEAALDRGMWKLKSTTATWVTAVGGGVISGYNFDVTYSDIPGGQYRIRLSSGPASDEVTVTAEARSSSSGQTRAVQARFKNLSFPGAMITGGNVTYNAAFECHWGAVLAGGNITISGNAATEYFPRKFSKQVVVGTMGQPRDVNGLNPPNTDNVEWWSDYQVPDLPLLDFAAMRSSAAANGTLNYNTNSGSSGSGKCVGWSGHGRCMSGSNSWSSHTSAFTSGNYHFFDSDDHALSKNNLIWYWDPGINVTLSGNTTSGCHRLGLYGTIVVRGNLTIDAGDCYSFTGTVPAEAWKEYSHIKTAQWDTTTVNEYPADNGFQTNRLTFNHGSETWTGGPLAGNTDVGIRGLLYVGGTLTLNSVTDVAGTVWVAGDVVNNTASERVLVFYQGSLPQVPVLNVVLQRQSWREVPPDSTPWP